MFFDVRKGPANGAVGPILELGTQLLVVAENDTSGLELFRIGIED